MFLWLMGVYCVFVVEYLAELLAEQLHSIFDYSTLHMM